MCIVCKQIGPPLLLFVDTFGRHVNDHDYVSAPSMGQRRASWEWHEIKNPDVEIEIVTWYCSVLLLWCACSIPTKTRQVLTWRLGKRTAFAWNRCKRSFFVHLTMLKVVEMRVFGSSGRRKQHALPTRTCRFRMRLYLPLLCSVLVLLPITNNRVIKSQRTGT